MRDPVLDGSVQASGEIAAPVEFRQVLPNVRAIDKIVKALNTAFKKDRNAIRALLLNRVPCNSELAHDEFVVVNEVIAGEFQVGAMGLVNAVLAAAGLPLLAFISDSDTGLILGFCEYQEPSAYVEITSGNRIKLPPGSQIFIEIENKKIGVKPGWSFVDWFGESIAGSTTSLHGIRYRVLKNGQ